MKVYDTEMPSFKFDYILPSDLYDIKSVETMFRFNNFFGDGSINGWLQPMPDPELSVSIGSEQMIIYADDQEYNSGGSMGNSDQFCRISWGIIDASENTPLNPGTTVSISGRFQQVSYFSLAVYIVYGDNLIRYVTIRAKDMTAVPPGLNPYTEGNPSVFAYPAPQKTDKLLPTKLIKNAVTRQQPVTQGESNIYENGWVDIYRIDRLTGTTGSPDGMEADGCADYYITYHDDLPYSAFIFRIKVPDTFVKNGSPDKIYGSYQCSEYIISSYQTRPASVPILPYWETCSRQMYENIDDNGYAYVFLLSDEYVQSLIEEQQTPYATPPIVSWGNFKGPALGLPTRNVSIRLRGPSENWAGAPINTACYFTPIDNQPLTAEALGEWLPELYGDTFANFLNGNIGAVSNDQPWPESHS